MSAIFRKFSIVFRSILFLTIPLTLFSCSNTTERDPTSESIESDSSLFHADIEINLSGYGKHYDLIIKGVLSDSKSTIKADSTKFFVNNEAMEYSVGRGNYYEEYPSFRMTFDDKHKLKEDTLKFSILLKDSSLYDIGYIDIEPLLSFMQDKNLYQNIQPDITKPLVVNWGGPLAESLSIQRTYEIPNKEGGTSIESNWITQQKWNPAKPFTIPANLFTINKGSVNTLYVTWGKESTGKMINDKIGGSIKATATLEQEIIIKPRE